MRNIRKPDIGCIECEQIISMVHAHRAEVEIIDFLTRVEFRRLFQRLKCELGVAGLLRNECQPAGSRHEEGPDLSSEPCQDFVRLACIDPAWNRGFLHPCNSGLIPPGHSPACREWLRCAAFDEALQGSRPKRLYRQDTERPVAWFSPET